MTDAQICPAPSRVPHRPSHFSLGIGSEIHYYLFILPTRSDSTIARSSCVHSFLSFFTSRIREISPLRLVRVGHTLTAPASHCPGRASTSEKGKAAGWIIGGIMRVNVIKAGPQTTANISRQGLPQPRDPHSAPHLPRLGVLLLRPRDFRKQTGQSRAMLCLQFPINNVATVSVTACADALVSAKKQRPGLALNNISLR